MGKPIEITRLEFSASALRELAAGTRDGAVVRRLLGIALILEGHAREAAAGLSGMDRQTLRDWVHRYNVDGVAGLSSRCSPGRPPTLNEAQMEELRSIVLAGPDVERNKVVRWRCVDLRAEIAVRWSVTLTRGTVGRLLRRLRMTRLQPRPYHPKKDAAAQEAFKKLCQPGDRGAAGRDRGHADRGLVPGRSQGGAEGIVGVYLGTDWVASTDGTRQSP
jgi:transposase